MRGADSLGSVTTAYRCGACGNRTRFDVLSERRSRAFHHYALDGSVAVEEEEVLSMTIEAVTCRWCGSSAAIEEIEVGATPSSARDPRSGAEPAGSGSPRH